MPERETDMGTTELMNLSTEIEVMTYLAQKMLDTLAVSQAAIDEALAAEEVTA